MDQDTQILCSEASMDFLIFSCLGITPGDGIDDIMNAAINRAYRDAASHVLKIDDKRKIAKEKAVRNIKEAINTLSGTADYDKWHEKLCKELKKTYENEMSDGIAQKWVNMTMKYLYILNDVTGNFAFIKSAKAKLHVPIDRYIIRAILKNEPECLPLNEKAFKNGRLGKITFEKIEAWSHWKYEEYFKVQECLREIAKKEGVSPMDWEGSAWISEAKKNQG